MTANLENSAEAIRWEKVSLGFPGSSEVKASACNAGDLGSIPGLERSPGKEMAIHSSILAWRISWVEDPGRLSLHRGHKESDMTE